MMRLPILDWVRWPSWMRNEPKSGLAETGGVAIRALFLLTGKPHLVLRRTVFKNNRCRERFSRHMHFTA